MVMATPDELARQQGDLVVRATAMVGALDVFINNMRADIAARRVRDEDQILEADRILDAIDKHLRVLEALYADPDASPPDEAAPPADT